MATATAWETTPRLGYVHYVGTDPDHRGFLDKTPWRPPGEIAGPPDDEQIRAENAGHGGGDYYVLKESLLS